MGKKIINGIDWTLDRGNEVGDIVMITQHARTNLGVVSFPGQALLHNYYATVVNETYNESQTLHQRVLEQPIDSASNMRHIFDDKLLKNIYIHGSQLVLSIYLMFEHFALHAGINAYRRSRPEYFDIFEKLELKDKLKDIFKVYDALYLLNSAGYGVLFSDVERIRHAVNHPKGNNIYSVNESNWDNVPFAWFVSGKHLEASKKCINLYNKMYEAYEKYIESHKQPGLITLEGPIVSRVSSQKKKAKGRSKNK